VNNLKIFNAIGFLKGLYFYIPIFAAYLLSNEISVSHLLFAQALFSLFVFIGEVPTGLFADRFGQKTSIILGYLVEAFGIVLVIMMPTVAGLYIAGCLRGIGNSFLSGSEEALLYESAKATDSSNYQKLYGRFISNEHIGYIFATVFAGLAYQFLGTQAFIPLIILTGVCIAAAAGMSFMLKDFKSAQVNGAEGSGLFTLLRESASLISRNDIVRTLTIVGALTISGEYFIQSVYQPYFELHGVTPFWIGAVLSIGTLFSVVSSRYAYLFERYLTLEKILLFINLTLGAAYILMAFFVHPVFLVGVYALMGGLFYLQMPIVSDYINNRTHSSIRSTVLSGVSFFRRFFQVFIMWALSISVGVYGAQASLLLQGTYLILGILIGYYLLVRCGCTHKVANAEGEELKF
jgi:MFS family permease